MSETSPKWSLVAAMLTESLPEFVRVAASLIPEARFADLPPISDAEEVELWSYLEELLTVEETAVFVQKVSQSPALQAHLAYLIRMSEADSGRLDRSPPVRQAATVPAADFVVLLTPAALARPKTARRTDARSFTMARSGAERVTSLQETRLTSLGTFVVTIDRQSATLCQVTIEPKSLSTGIEDVVCDWTHATTRQQSRQSFAEGFVRFTDVSPGHHEFRFRRRTTDLDGFTLSLQLADEDASE